MRSSMLLFFVVCIYLSRYSVQATIFSCNSTTSCGCSRYNANINARIVGGEPAVSHSWGWAVSLRLGIKDHKCGGAILSPNYILTAAHCVEKNRYQPSMYTIVIGADTLNSSDGQTFTLSSIFIHPSFNTDTKNNDIAILSLTRPISFVDMNVAKICLPSLPKSEQPHYPIVNKPVVHTIQYYIAIGWGQISSSGSLSNVLRQVTLKTVKNTESKCKPSIHDVNLQFCAAVDGGGKDTCQGDSGGPLMYYSQNEQRWVLAGITSYGRGCALPNYAGVYVRVSNYISWIESIVGSDGIVTIPQSKANIGSISSPIIFAAALFLILISFDN